MIKAESQVIDNDSCEITMEVEGRLKDIERVVLIHFIKRLSDQFEGVNYGVIGYREKDESSIS